MIPHIFIGLYMYSNSSILTPNWLKQNFASFIKTSNRYINSERFATIHSAIFIATAAILLAILLLRYSLVFAVRRLYLGCKSALQRHKFLGDLSETYSDNFYGSLNAD